MPWPWFRGNIERYAAQGVDKPLNCWPFRRIIRLDQGPMIAWVQRPRSRRIGSAGRAGVVESVLREASS
jgi:hypothetical protein